MAGAPLIGKAGQDHTALQLACWLQFPDAHGVHALQKGISASQQQSTQGRAGKKTAHQFPQGTGDTDP